MSVLNRRALLSGMGAACLTGTAALLSSRPAGAQTVPAQARAQAPLLTRAHGLITVNEVIPAQAWVALTFDDGPHPQHTPTLLDILAAWQVRATFFVIGQQVRRFPDIARRIVAEGHELGNHTWRHPTLSQLGDAQVLSEIDRTQDIIWQTVGHVPVTMRPPYGALSRRQAGMVQASRNLPNVLWSVDPEDWRRPGSTVVADRMVRGARPGAIILAHDIHGATIRAIPDAIAGIRARGLQPVTLSELLGWGRWGPGGGRFARGAPILTGDDWSSG